MANLTLALEEIINQNRRAQVGRKNRLGNVGAGHSDKRLSARSRFPQRGFVSGDVPAGRWKHDKFFEAYGSNNGVKANRSKIGMAKVKQDSGLFRKVKSNGGIAAKIARKAIGSGQSGMIKLQILSLPKSVVTSDLEELLQDYNCYGVTVHYDELGNHLGTADLFTDRKTAMDIIQDFKDIAIDGQEIKFCVVAESGRTLSSDSTGVSNLKMNISDRLRRVSTKLIQRRRARVVIKKRVALGGSKTAIRAGRKVTTGKRNQMKEKKLRTKTAEELDKDLESYMLKK